MSEPIHVIPVDDLKEHILESTCSCSPALLMILGSMIYIHNAWDGRGRYEGQDSGLFDSEGVRLCAGDYVRTNEGGVMCRVAFSGGHFWLEHPEFGMFPLIDVVESISVVQNPEA